MSSMFFARCATTVISYIDSSCVIRRLVGDGPPLATWGAWDAAVSSEVGRIEVHRTLARLLHEGRLNNNGWAEALQRFGEIEQGVLWIPLTPRVAAVAAGPFPTVLKALDAIHLASAAFVRETSGPDLNIATHDRQLASAAAAMGFDVVGV